MRIRILLSISALVGRLSDRVGKTKHRRRSFRVEERRYEKFYVIESQSKASSSITTGREVN